MRTMKTKDGRTYFTALKKGSIEVDVKAVTEYENEKVKAFVHDIHDGYDSRFDEADVIYCEPAWRPGYVKFMEMAGKDPQKYGYNKYLKAIHDFAKQFGKPFYCIGSVAMMKILQPDDSQPIVITPHGSNDAIGVFNGTLFDCPNTDSFITELCKKYTVIGDIFCGAGYTFSHALPHNRFILSDVNPECIGFIAKEAEHGNC